MGKAVCVGGPYDGAIVSLDPGHIGYVFSLRDRRGFYFGRPYMAATYGERDTIYYVGPNFPSRYRERATWLAKLRRYAREEAMAG